MKPDFLADESIYPLPEIASRLQWMQDAGEALELYDRVWTEVKACRKQIGLGLAIFLADRHPSRQANQTG